MPVRLLILLAVAVAGCAASSPRVSAPDEIAPRARDIGALVDSLGRAPSSAVRRAVAARQLAAAGVTPLANTTFEVGLRVPFVGGYVPGRQPVVRDELVVVGVSLESAAAAAVLEAARVLVARSAWETTPERTVQFVFWSGRTTDREGIEGALRLPLWPRGNVAAVVLVGDAAARLGVGDIPVTVVPVAGDVGPDLAARVVQAAVVQAASSFLPEADR